MEKRNITNTLVLLHLIPLKRDVPCYTCLINMRCMQVCRLPREATKSTAYLFVIWRLHKCSYAENAKTKFPYTIPLVPINIALAAIAFSIH